MLRNYIKIAIRAAFKNKLFSLINVIGMAISMACVLIIGIYIDDELRFDRHVVAADRKFRVYNEIYNDNTGVRLAANIPPPIAPGIKADFPEVKAFTRYQHINSPLLFQAGEKRFTETRGGYADATIFNMLSIDLRDGNTSGALAEPNAIAISETLSSKYFGDTSALGKSLVVNNENFKVTAVFQDMSKHAHFQADYLVSMATLERAAPELMKSWRWMQFHTYIEVTPGTNVPLLQGKIQKFIEANAWPVTKPDGSHYIPFLMPIQDIHLYATEHLWDTAVKGNVQTIQILGATAIFILVIAALNFINLSTARAESRVKEVGLRKTVGAARWQLVSQFLSESVVLSLIAFFIAGLIVEVSLPAINAFMEKDIPSNLFLHPARFAALTGIVILIGIIAGVYPAFYVTKLRPSTILSGKSTLGKERSFLRTSLVVVQFILSFAMIIASFVASDQNSFLRGKDIGFSKENVVVLQLRGNMRQRKEAVKQLFKNHPNVKSVSMQYGLPGEIYPSDVFIDEVNKKSVHTSLLLIDHDFVQTLGLTMRAGRAFSEDFPTDLKQGFMITETMAQLMGFDDAEKAIGHPVSWDRWDSDSLKHGEIIGVVKDFHLNSLKEKIAPVVLQIYPRFFSTVAVRINGEDVPATIAHLQSAWNSLDTGWPFEYRFLDTNFDRMYKAEDKLSSLFTFFTIFSILVACLGLFGLVVYSTSQRFKEIAIRKVLGAETGNLIVSLSGNYLILMLIAFAIATPLSYYAALEWLTNFAYHIDITWMLFGKAVVMILVICLVTVSLQALRAAQRNPTEALKEQ